MVHGGCASIGCYAMTNAVVDEIWQLITAALKNGQPRFSVHAFPFRMSEHNMEWYADKRWKTFWSDLKRGYDMFERTKVPPVIATCNRRYLVSAGRPGSKGEDQVLQQCKKALTKR